MKLTSHRARTKAFADNHINPKLRRSLRIYLVVALVIFVVVIVTTIRSRANPGLVALGLVLGVVVGVAFNRIYKISWDKAADHAVYKMDVFGIILLLVYIAFDLSRSHLVGLFIHGSSLEPTSLALLAGLFYGRVLGTGREIIRVFKREHVV